MSSPHSSDYSDEIQRLFDAVLDLSVDEREAYLRQYCSENPALRTEVESLLEAYSRHSSDVRNVFEHLPLATGDNAESDPQGFTGRVVSHYLILEHVGDGGMGSVYKARDTRLDRTVALKFLPPNLGYDNHARARFTHEARTASALDHPNICTIYDIDEVENNRLFIAMSFCDGESLKAKIERGPLPIDQTLDYTIQVARGLLEAHKRGIMHRDIKPGNVMVTNEGAVKIVDFGLAKMTAVDMTKTGATMGTALYMSPEQTRGEKVDARTDIWSLGVVLYEILTAISPFRRSSYEAAILYAVINEEPESILSIRPEVPEQLTSIVERMLKKDPDDRYQNIGDVVKDLQSVRDTIADPVVSTPAARDGVQMKEHGFFTRCRLYMSRFQRAIYTGVGLTFIILTVVFASRLFNQTQNHELALEHLGTGNEYFINQQFTQAQSEYERAVELDPQLAEAWDALAATKIRNRDFASAISDSRRALALDSTYSNTYYNLALALQETGAVSEAIQAYQDAIRLNPLFTPAYSALGNLYIQQDRTSEALQILERGKNAAPDSTYLYLIYKNMGLAYSKAEDFDQAVTNLEVSLRLNPVFFEAVQLLAQTYESAGQVLKSREVWEQYLEVETDETKRQAALEHLQE